MGQSQPLFDYFVLITFNFNWQIYSLNYLKWKKRKWCAWDLNPGWQVGRRRQIHWAMVAPPYFWKDLVGKFSFWCISNGWWFLGCIGNWQYLCKTAKGTTYWATFDKNRATFYSIILSHWLRASFVQTYAEGEGL